MRWALALLGGSVLAIAALAYSSEGVPASSPQRPNVILVLTDDQALHEMKSMPATRALIGGHGVRFKRAYISYPLCCPSRTSFLTGRYMHNHQVRGNTSPYGGYGRFAGSGGESTALPVWLDDAGYHTVFIGKYLNGYGRTHATVPAGWDEWYGKTSTFSFSSRGGSVYYDYTLIERPNPGKPPRRVHFGSRPRAYQTGVYRRKAVGAIRRLSASPPTSRPPLFMMVNFSAPHAPFLAAPRDLGSLRGTKLPRLPGFNERDISDKPGFLRHQARRPISAGEIALLRHVRRKRLEQLRSVDRAVAAIVRALRREGALDDTYIVFASDNGYIFGEHRITEGKYLPYEPATRVPFLIRGPGIPKGRVSGELVANIDFAPTVLRAAGIPPPAHPAIDGRSLLPFARSPRRRSNRPLLLEADTGPGRGLGAGGCRIGRVCDSLAGAAGVDNLEQEPTAGAASVNVRHAPAYRAIRTRRWLFVAYTGGAEELYDMKRDPAQLHSLDRSRRYRRLKRHLAAMLSRLAACEGAGCRVGAVR